jgi:hypothetical protein
MNNDASPIKTMLTSSKMQPLFSGEVLTPTRTENAVTRRLQNVAGPQREDNKK